MKGNLIRSLRGEEGEVLTEYKDHLGYSTIGVGRLIDKRKGGGITKEESAYLLNNDIDKIVEQLDKRISWWETLDEARRGVLVNMAFQMGVDGLLGFKNTLNMIQSGRYSDAAKGMLNSLWAKQTPARAKRMSEQMRTGVWQFKSGM
ncbi:MAG: glycoside hydrolase family protein [Acinetobacter sp.]|uniref:Lysozyme n=1 Tax=Acinetobacter faecalis TaxID=2665161 RepID=A0ABU5GJU9_9GAMM|nr:MULTISPECIES: glycoside hydrolase family protein [Acinetobacter]MDY6550764.1 glycoside hydrolase family protein [Acinetobacter faecalis]UBX51527.1 glycoside hydrolase family protein [Acinetobacter pseudolwoffii]